MAHKRTSARRRRVCLPRCCRRELYVVSFCERLLNAPRPIAKASINNPPRRNEIGVGPSIVVVDAGVGKSLTTTTITQDVYAFIFSQKGLMAGVGIQGSKITKISK